jgi:glucose/mannose-6-phosphate isomerase
MDLEDVSAIKRLDPQGMIDQINGLPDQLEKAWELGQALPLPGADGLERILLAGMGGSATGADLAAAYAAPACPLPITVLRQYSLPAWASGPQTLVIASSHSGNTEEILSVFEQAHARGCRVVVLGAGGRLAELGRARGDSCWLFEHAGQPRAGVGFAFGLLVSGLHRLGLLPDPDRDLRDTLHALRNQQTNLLPEVPVAYNPAKRLAGQMVERWVCILAADDLEPVARRWQAQINETAKSWAQFETLPEVDHNTLAGLFHPEDALSRMIALFLSAPSNHPRNRLRLELTRKMFMLQGINTDVVSPKGESKLAHLWTLLHLGDYTSYYLAMAYGEDPAAVDAIRMLKMELDQSRED